MYFYSDIECIKISRLSKKDVVLFGGNFEVLLDSEAIRHPVPKGVVTLFAEFFGTH
jgi:hypothetical protein